MALSGRRVSVGTTATLLTTTETDRTPGQSIIVNNTGAAAVDLGPAGVTSGAGFSLAAGQQLSLDTFGEALYAIAASGTVTVQVLEVGT